MQIQFSGELESRLRRLDVGSKVKITVEFDVTSINLDDENREFERVGGHTVKVIQFQSHGAGGLSPDFEKSVMKLRTMGTMG